MNNEILSFEDQAIQQQVKEILVKHNLDFTIVKVPMVGIIGDVQYPSTYFGLLNTQSNEIINTTKESYHVSQNNEVVELIIRGMQGFGELSIIKAGSLNGGRKTFIQLGIAGLTRVGNDDIKRFITIIDSNDGSTGLSVGIGDLTMSCSNQFYRFYKRGEMKLKHSSSLEAKMRELPSLIQLALSESMRQVEAYQRFYSTAASKSLVDSLVREMIGFDRVSMDDELHSTKAINSMNELYFHIDKEMAQKGENVWGLHSGVTSWTTHKKSAPKRDNGRLESSMVGTNYKTNLDSFEFCLSVVGVGDLVLS